MYHRRELSIISQIDFDFQFARGLSTKKLQKRNGALLP